MFSNICRCPYLARVPILSATFHFLVHQDPHTFPPVEHTPSLLPFSTNVTSTDHPLTLLPCGFWYMVPGMMELQIVFRIVL
jgi:hypothetical protein